MNFTARCVSVEEDEFTLRVALSDQPEGPTHYLVLERSLDESEAQDGLYCEFDDQINSFYEGLHRIQLSQAELRLSINSCPESRAAR
jgi:hypothetical protein